MQQWEYRVVSFRDGHYTESLNAYGQEGWELVSVVRDDPPPPLPGRGRKLPVPGAIGRLENAAETIGKIGGSGEPDEPATTSLVWVLRRPLPDDD